MKSTEDYLLNRIGVTSMLARSIASAVACPSSTGIDSCDHSCFSCPHIDHSEPVDCTCDPDVMCLCETTDDSDEFSLNCFAMDAEDTKKAMDYLCS